MMNKTKEIIGKLGSTIYNPSNRKYTAYIRITNPSQLDALQNQFEFSMHHRNCPCF